MTQQGLRAEDAIVISMTDANDESGPCDAEYALVVGPDGACWGWEPMGAPWERREWRKVADTLADAFRVLSGRDLHVEDIGVHFPGSEERSTSLTHVLDALR
jgi:hypothetical protein